MDFVPLQSFDNYIDAHIVLGRMEEEGIQCWLKDENTITVTPIFNNAVGGIKLMVNREQLEKASRLLNQFQQEKKSKLGCPNCGSNDIELIPSRKPLNILGAIATWLTGRYALSVDNVWHCFNCHKEFKEPLDTGNQNGNTTEITE
jgi:hypothetical protein